MTISANQLTILKDQELVLPAWLAATGESELANDRLIHQAYLFAREQHTGQMRKSGEPYICHPIAVADILYNLGGEAPMIAAGFLHDIVEDVEEITVADIEKMFGAETAHLVEGVTKLSKLNFRSKKEQQAENFRRMFLAMAQDIRVIVVKLADRLHNMQTLEHMPIEKQKLIAQETRDIFAPLANRLGLGRIKWELEDLAFKYIEPDEYRNIQDLVKETRKSRECRITSTVEQIRTRLADAGFSYFDVTGRPKHLFSIHQKMKSQKKEFGEIYDLTAIRIIVPNNADCYRVLAEVHDAFRPIPGRFKDYIGLPKPNRYQSLHTTVLGIGNTPLEIQIRTTEMHRIAEYGIAAHWKYKEAANNANGAATGAAAKKDDKFIWLRQLLEWQSDFKDAQEFSDNLKDQLCDPDVYVFTPQGEVIALREKATTIDFAYRIHTEVGNHCIGARINGRIVPLSTRVRNGDIVEIMTKESGHPSLDWLNFVATPTAKNRITQWYKRSNRDENIARGRELLEKELGKNGLDALLKSDPMLVAAQKCNYQTVEDLLAALGYGETTINHVVNRIRDTVKTAVAETAELLEILPTTTKKPSSTDGDFPIIGIEGLMHHLAGCCNPIPEEPIVGVVTKLNGISIHRQGCGNVENVDGDRILPVRWNPHHSAKQQGNRRSYIVTLQVEVFDRLGVMRDVMSRLSDNKVNIRQAKVTADNKSKPVMLDFMVEVIDKSQLERCINQIRQMHDVLHVRRITEMSEQN
jgi:GTP diphosphokinase / guanosine-3',5'-bis(diphosphate) 3'-diphosphatase